MAASRVQSELTSRARLEDEPFKLFAQEMAARRLLRDSQGAAPHAGAEPLDQPRLADDQPVSSPSEWAVDRVTSLAVVRGSQPSYGQTGCNRDPPCR